MRVAALAVALLVAGSVAVRARAPRSSALLEPAQELFYNGQYAAAADLAQTLSTDEDPLAVFELRTSAILFQLRRLLDSHSDKEKGFKNCAACPDLLASFMRELTAGQKAARSVLETHPKDAKALFYLGKLDLNYVWLVLGTLGRKTGWNEYWEARRSLDAALSLEPTSQRARVARAWIDYIVDTRMPWGTGWLLGGGNKKKAMAVMRDAASRADDHYAHAEALFGLWDMQVREKRHDEALESALELAAMFPGNPEVARFVAARSK